MKIFRINILLSAILLVFSASFLAGESKTQEPVIPGPDSVEPEDGEIMAFIELLRSDVQTEKALIIAENLPLTHDEAAEFWPLQREYEFELNKLLDERLAIIMKFVPMTEGMTDEQAKELAKVAFSLEEKRTKLKRSTFKKFCEAIPAAKAARFFQIENQLNAAIDLRVAASIPLID